MRIKQIIAILLVLITIVTTLSIFKTNAKAATYLIDEADLYSKEELVCFTYQGIKIGVEFVVYKKDGVEYPAYCLDKTLPGVTTDGGYTVSVDKLVNNNKIWRAVTNGYPFKTAKQLGCNSDAEAFAATKMAVYDAMYNYDWDDFEGLNAQGDRIVTAAEKISKAARSSSETKPVSVVSIGKVDEEWALDGKDDKYISKEFKINCNLEYAKYSLKLNNLNIEGVKLVDENNNEKKEFKSGENFKVLIPIAELSKSGEFEIEATVDVKTKPVLYGDSGDNTKQSYALAAGDYEFESTKLNIKYSENATKIEIIKKDAETEEPLQGAKFNILNENKEIIYSDVTTNEEGKAIVEKITPGKYFIQEIKAPDGYTIYDELIEIDVELNQKYIVNVNNYEKPEDEEKQVDDVEITKTGDKEVYLPRTGF